MRGYEPESCAGNGGIPNTDARWVSAFAIPYDQTTGTVTDGTTTHLVKWLNREIRLAQKSTTTCTGAAGLTLPSGQTLPASSSLKDPSDSTSDVYLGTEPTVTAAPRVIQGVVQY